MIDQITPLILCYNEADNIGRTLSKLLWAKRIVVIDSGSTDGTLKILGGYRQVVTINRPFVDFASQCNFGLSQIETDWALSLDADYELSDELVAELQALVPHEDTVGYRARFVYRIWGRPLRGTLYPPRVVLYRKNRAKYHNEGHGHRVSLTGIIADLKNVIFHDDRKPIARWIASQQRYARVEADYLLTGSAKLSRTDKIRAMGWPAPFLILFYTLFVKGCAMDGWPGWHYALQRLIFETFTALELADRRLRTKM